MPSRTPHVDPRNPLSFDATTALASLARPPRIRLPASPPPEAFLLDAARRPGGVVPSLDPVAATPAPAPAPPPQPAPPGERIDARGHFDLPPGPLAVAALPADLAGRLSLVRAEADLVAGVPDWSPAARLRCPGCGEAVGFEARPSPGGRTLVALGPCAEPAGSIALEAAIQVPSGRIVAAPDLGPLSRVECAPRDAARQEARAADAALAASGILRIRTRMPDAALYRRGRDLLVAHGDPPADGPVAAERLCDLGAWPPRPCLMDADLFHARCRREGIDPASLRPREIALAPGAYAIVARHAGELGPVAVHAVLSPAEGAPGPVDPEYGNDVADGQARALLVATSRRESSAFAALARCLCSGGGDHVWSGGLLRTGPRPRDDDDPGLDRPTGLHPYAGEVPVWSAILPPAPGGPGHRAAGIAERLSWFIPHLAEPGIAPIQRLPTRMHPHWLAAALLLAKAAVNRPDLLADRHGRPCPRQMRRMQAALARLCARASDPSARAGVEAAIREWLAEDVASWPGG